MKKLLLLFLLPFLFTTPAFAATPTSTAKAQTASSACGTASCTLALTIPSGNQNNLLVVFVSNRCGGATFSATYNGTAMTLQSSPAAVIAFQTAYFYLPAPTADGSAHNIVVSWTGTSCSDTGLAAINLKDAVQSSPVDIDGYLGQNTASSITISKTTSTANDLLLAWFAEDSFNGLSSGWTDGTGQTKEIGAATLGTTQAYGEISSKPSTTAGSYTMSLSWTGARAADEMFTSIKYQAPTVTTPSGWGFLTFFGWF